MRLNLAIASLFLAGLAACGGGKQDGIVQFHSTTPTTSIAMKSDQRKITTHCPGCKAARGVDVERCPEKKKCDTRIKWSESYPCGYCNGSGKCTACVMYEQISKDEAKNGKCDFCKGEGILPYKGKTPECKNCGGKKVCPICSGSTKCDFCKGEGKLTKAQIQEHAAKAAAASAPPGENISEKPEAAPKPPEEKKDDAAKPEEKKE